MKLNGRMRVHILSDLHREFGGAMEIPATGAEVVVLAGDIDVGREGCRWARRQFPNQPVIYVMGNHEFYRHSLPQLTESLRAEMDGSQVCLLENSAVEINGYTFLGCTLWTDFQVTGNPVEAMRVAEGGVSDYHVVRYNPEHRLLRPSDTVRLHGESVAWLRQELGRHDPARTVVVTHHAPSARTEAPVHEHSALKGAFESNLDVLVEQSRVPLWIYGHTHYNTDFKMGSTRVLSNQRGYPGGLCEGFQAGLVVEV